MGRFSKILLTDGYGDFFELPVKCIIGCLLSAIDALQTIFWTRFPYLDEDPTWAGLIKGLAQSRHSSSGFHTRHPSHATVSSWKDQRANFQALSANVRLLHWLSYSPKNSLFTLNTFKQPVALQISFDKGNRKRKILRACLRMRGRCSKALDGLISSRVHRVNKHLALMEISFHS